MGKELRMGGKYFVVRENDYGYVLECTLKQYNSLVGRYEFAGVGKPVYVFEELVSSYVFSDKKEADKKALTLLESKLDNLKFMVNDLEFRVDKLKRSIGDENG